MGTQSWRKPTVWVASLRASLPHVQMWPWHQTSENPYLQQFSISYFPLKEDDEGEEGDEDDDDDGSEMELDEDYPDMNASPLVRFERFDREDDLIIEFDNMFSSASKIQGPSWVLSLDSYTLL